MNPGTIVGIVLAILAVIILCFVLIFFFLNKRKKGDWLITDKAESPVAYTNGGFRGEHVNVVNFTEIPFPQSEPSRPKLDVPAVKRDAHVHNGTHDPVVKTSLSVDSNRENSTNVSVNAEHALHEIDFLDSDDDYATLDSVAKSRSKKADAGEKKKANHEEATQMPQLTVQDGEIECEYATVIPKSLRGNKDSFREKAEVILNIDTDTFHT